MDDDFGSCVSWCFKYFEKRQTLRSPCGVILNIWRISRSKILSLCSWTELDRAGQNLQQDENMVCLTWEYLRCASLTTSHSSANNVAYFICIARLGRGCCHLWLFMAAHRASGVGSESKLSPPPASDAVTVKPEHQNRRSGTFGWRLCKQRTQGRGSIIIPKPWYTTSKVRSTIIGGGADWGSWPVMWFGSSNRTNAQHPNYNLKSGIQKKRSGSTMQTLSHFRQRTNWWMKSTLVWTSLFPFKELLLPTILNSSSRNLGLPQRPCACLGSDISKEHDGVYLAHYLPKQVPRNTWPQVSFLADSPQVIVSKQMMQVSSEVRMTCRMDWSPRRASDISMKPFFQFFFYHICVHIPCSYHVLPYLFLTYSCVFCIGNRSVASWPIGPRAWQGLSCFW